MAMAIEFIPLLSAVIKCYSLVSHRQKTLLLTGTYERSRGEAAYADRMMDGSKFDRDAWNLDLYNAILHRGSQELELRYGQSKIDHVMDNL